MGTTLRVARLTQAWQVADPLGPSRAAYLDPHPRRRRPARSVRDVAWLPLAGAAADSVRALVAPPAELLPIALGVRTNHGHNQHGLPLVGFAPHSADEALRQIAWAERNHLPVSAEGSLHSWSAASMVNGGVALVPWGMRSEHPLEDGTIMPLAAEEAVLRPSALAQARGRFWVTSGTQLRQLNRVLWEQGFSIPVMGGYDAQTVGGALPTGTHGSVLLRGPMAELAKGFELVRHGTKTRLEPANGPTDPAKFRREHPDWQLVQDDDQFRAAQLGMGTAGFVTRVLLQTTPRFYLRERRMVLPASEVRRILHGENIYGVVEHANPKFAGRHGAMFPGQSKRVYHLELALDPHSDSYLVTLRDKVGAAEATRLDELARAHPDYFEDPWTTDPVKAFSRPAELTRPPLSNLVPGYFHSILGKVFEFASEHVPGAIPKLVGAAGATATDREYVNRSYNVFHLGEGPSNIPSEVGTLSVPLRGDMYLEAVEVMKQVMAKFRAEKGWEFPGLISLRFVKGTDILLADNEDVCKFEIILSGESEFIQRQAQAYVDAFYAALDERFPGLVRAHFGHMIPAQLKGPDAARKLRELFPADPGSSESRYDRFLEAREQLDPDGTFITPGKQEMFPGVHEPATGAQMGAHER
jgi:FAD/FMN-containing dehydrogenase